MDLLPEIPQDPESEEGSVNAPATDHQVPVDVVVLLCVVIHLLFVEYCIYKYCTHLSIYLSNYSQPNPTHFDRVVTFQRGDTKNPNMLSSHPWLSKLCCPPWLISPWHQFLI